MKGITPVVSTVLLIALAVISAMGVYWWISGRAAPPETPSTFATISVEVPSCASSGNTTILITNTSPPGKKITANSLETDWSGGLAANNSAGTGTCPPEEMSSGETVSCVLVNYHAGDGTVAIYGNKVAAYPVTC